MDSWTRSKDREQPCPGVLRLLQPCQPPASPGDPLGPHLECRGVPACSTLALKESDNAGSSKTCQHVLVPP